MVRYQEVRCEFITVLKRKHTRTPGVKIFRSGTFFDFFPSIPNSTVYCIRARIPILLMEFEYFNHLWTHVQKPNTDTTMSERVLNQMIELKECSGLWSESSNNRGRSGFYAPLFGGTPRFSRQLLPVVNGIHFDGFKSS